MSPRWAVFISGRGSNFAALTELLQEIDIALCVSSRSKALGLLQAKRSGIETLILAAQPNWLSLHQELKRRNVNRIFLLGFMKILPADFVEKWQGKIWNLHPSLLPDYAGKEAIEKSYQAAAAMGVSVHEVIAEMDEGKLILQTSICERSLTGPHKFSLSEAQSLICRQEQKLVRELAVRQNREGRKDLWI